MHKSIVLIVIALALIIIGVAPIYIGAHRSHDLVRMSSFNRYLFYIGLHLMGIGLILIGTGLILYMRSGHMRYYMV